MRAVAAADGSVGRIFEGHLNARRAARRRRARAAAHGRARRGPRRAACSASGAPTPRPARASRRARAARRRCALTATKIFCSGAGGLDRALVHRARAEASAPRLAYVDLADGRRDRPRLVPRRRHARVGEPPRGLRRRAGPRAARRAGRARRASRGSRATRSAPPRAWAGIADAAVDAALADLAARARARRPARARRRADRDRARRRSTAGSSTRRPRRPERRPARRSRSSCASAVADAGRDDARRGRARVRLAPVRDRHGARPRAARLRAVRAPAPARPAGRPARAAPRWRRAMRAARSRPAYFERLYAGDPDPWDFATSAVRARRSTTRRSPRSAAAASRIGARGRLLDRRAHRAARRRAASGCSRSTSPRPRCEQRARLARVPNVTFERRELPEELPAGAFDLIVSSEVLYYLDAARVRRDARRDRPRARAPGRCSRSTGATPTGTYPLRGDEVHARLRAPLRPARLTRATADYVLERFDAHERLVIVGGGPAGLAAARGYREAGGDGDVTLVTPEPTRPTCARRCPRSSCAARPTRRSPLEAAAWYAEHGIEVRHGATVERARPGAARSRSPAARRWRTTPACSPPAPSRTAARPGRRGCARAALLADRARAARARRPRARDRDRHRLHRLRGGRLARDARAPGDARDRGGSRRRRAWARRPGGGSRAGCASSASRCGSARGRGDRATSMRTSSWPRSAIRPRSKHRRARRGLAVEDGRIATDERMRTSAAASRGRRRRPRPQRRRRPPLPVEHWGEALTTGEVAGRRRRRATREWDEAPGFWSTIGDAHAQVRGVGRRLRRGAAGRPRRRRLHRLVRHAAASPSACSPTSATRTTSAAASWSRRERRCRELSPPDLLRAASSCPRATRRRSIGALHARARGPAGRRRAEYEVLLVLDRCTRRDRGARPRRGRAAA